jgi:tRNA (guanine37-N1)-methyltransferase
VKIDVITIFPKMIEGALAEGVVGRAAARGPLDVRVRDLRDFTADRHRSVDDVPYGGGPGMVMKPEPFGAALDAIAAARGTPDAVVLMSPQGRVFDQAAADRLSRLDHLVLLCGRYEGVDQRVAESVATEELSVGDYVLTGGELPALVVIDAVARLLPGVVGDAACVAVDSFTGGLLDHPQYTRPAEWRGHAVPEVLLSGHHQEIDRWRRREQLRRTFERRPDLLSHATLSDEDRRVLMDVQEESRTRGVGRDGRMRESEQKEQAHEGD